MYPSSTHTCFVLKMVRILQKEVVHSKLVEFFSTRCCKMQEIVQTFPDLLSIHLEVPDRELCGSRLGSEEPRQEGV